MATTRQLIAAMNPAEMVRRIEELEKRLERLERAQSQPSPAKKTAAPKK